ncbi:MAG: alpha/beta hydrolase [Actinobacteria bacterium]|nr:alpha/beta hydrolase [Actinomycetota bacterium]
MLLAGGGLAVVLGGLVVSQVIGGEGRTTGGSAPAVSPVSAERNVQFEGADGLTIGATLGLPADAAAGDDLAAVVVLPGFGPTDRDALYPPSTGPDPLYRDLSAALVDSGTVTLRYDKRGTGQSALAPGDQLTFDDLVTDAAAAVAFLSERAEVGSQRIAVVGHEEGGLVALQLAASDPRVASIVLVSVPGRPLVEVVADDFRNSGHGEDVDDLESVVASLLAGEDLPEPDALPASVRGFFPVGQGDYARGLFSIDPVALARRVDVPALVVRGERATGISAVDAEALVGALGDDAQALAAPDAGHTLMVTDPTEGAAPARPDASEHGGSSEHAGPSGSGHRDDDALTRIRDFLASTLS